MNYYQLSYDVLGGDEDTSRNEQALMMLLTVLRQKLFAGCISRPVRTTLMFLAEKDLGVVDGAISKWATDEKAFYVLSKVQPGAKTEKGEDTYYYAKCPNDELQAKIKDKLISIDTK